MVNSIIDELRHSINLNDIDAIKKIIEKDSEGICYTRAYSTEGKEVGDKSLCNGNYPGQDPPGNNVLLHAISSTRYEIADLLIDDAQKKLKEQDFINFINYQYPKVEDKLYYINTALTLAAKYENYQLVEKLLNLGANPDGTDQHGFTTATILCMQLGLVESKNPEIFSAINLLQEKGADFDQKDNFGFYPYNFIGYELNPEKLHLFKFLVFTPPNLETDRVYSLHEVRQHIHGVYSYKNAYVAEVAEYIIKNDFSISTNSNILWIFSTGEHNVDAAIFDSLKWGNGSCAVTEKILSYKGYIAHSIVQQLQKDQEEVIYKQDFLKSDEGIEMAKSLFDQIISNQVKDHEEKDPSIILKIMNFDSSSLPVPKDFNERVEIVADGVYNYKLCLNQSSNFSEEELIEPIQSILEEMQLDPLGSVPLH